MSGHYEYSDWLNQDVWVEDPPAAKVAPAAPVVAAGLPALAATQPAPAAAAPIAPVVALPNCWTNASFAGTCTYFEIIPE